MSMAIFNSYFDITRGYILLIILPLLIYTIYTIINIYHYEYPSNIPYPILIKVMFVVTTLVLDPRSRARTLSGRREVQRFGAKNDQRNSENPSEYGHST